MSLRTAVDFVAGVEVGLGKLLDQVIAVLVDLVGDEELVQSRVHTKRAVAGCWTMTSITSSPLNWPLSPRNVFSV